MLKTYRFVGLLLTLILLPLLAACDTGDTAELAAASAFTLPNAAGGEVSLSDYEGQPVLLYFHMAVG